MRAVLGVEMKSCWGLQEGEGNLRAFVVLAEFVGG